jgi:predicted O-methyltransferase YrrM
MTFEEIYEYVLNVGTDNVNGFSGRFEGGYRIFQHPEEITNLILYLLDKKINNYLEIGSAAGGTTRLLSDFLKIRNYYIVDDNMFWQSSVRKKNLKNLNVKEFIGNSHSAECDAFLAKSKVKFDFIFIDANHAYEAVKKDTSLSLKYCNRGCYIAFHDSVAFDGVKKWVSELKAKAELVFVKEFTSSNSRGLGIALFQYSPILL